MIYRIRHSTRYAYGNPVDLAAHLLHLTPRDLPGQRVLSADIMADPPASRFRHGRDHFGNHVTWLFVDAPHAAFEVVGEAVVEVRLPPAPPAAATPAWEEVAALARVGGPRGWQAAEFTFDSPMVPVEPAAGAYAAPSFPPGRPVLEGLLELNSRIRREFAYRSGVTSLSTPVAEVLARREGVCQDFSHLMISALRALGLPARYVSGYIRTRPPPGQVRRRGTDQSHAWVGCWLGPAHGWLDLDPTNGVVVQEEHVIVGWGRDYADVSPVSGIVLGGGEHGLSIAVDLDPVEQGAAAG
ncbi:transglutaminase family protein [Belnapia sp. T6]|uniref:Transglutaminase family protein n=1 Tax=Belnapia mucosa TaxID=2804532 RepID=A0ABS1UXL3_9PROT|nr:transglutaminase family protein [Belnapia mucosa]MBL6454201.1 transglutaminase family protein [Belnapia mucosa]